MVEIVDDDGDDDDDDRLWSKNFLPLR